MIELKGDLLKRIMDEYRPDNTIFNSDTEEMTQLKRICFESDALTQAEKIILLLYCETASTRRLGEILGVSGTTAYFEIRRIQNKVKEALGYNDDGDKSVADNSDNGVRDRLD